MVISNKFLHAADNALQQRVTERFLLELTKLFPERFSVDMESNNLAALAGLRKQAAKSGIITEKGSFVWIALRYVLSNDFFESDRWKGYLDAANKISDYAIGSFLVALNSKFYNPLESDNGFGLSEPAVRALQFAVDEAVSEIINDSAAIVTIYQLYFASRELLITSPAVVTKTTFNARISALNTDIRAHEEQIRKLNKPITDIRMKLVDVLTANNLLKEELAAHQEEHPHEEIHPQDASIKDNDTKVMDLIKQIDDEVAKNEPQVQKIKEKIKGFRREAELLIAQSYRR